MKEEGEEFEKNGNYESAIDTYTTAMICWYGESWNTRYC